ncbi:MAG: hypothetical protein H7336_04585 [Bacteriovorax sp.]|nr:hypothetical protein [Bacteriovorax sp.]
MITKISTHIALALGSFFLFEQNSFAINGSFKTYFSETKNSGEDSYNSTLSSIFRPKYTYAINDRYTFYGAYALSLDWEKKSPFLTTQQTPKKNYRAVDLERKITSSDRIKSRTLSLNQNLDRFYINYSQGAFNLNVGRAPIAFGSSKIINPTDVLTPVTYATLDKEERVGVDTVRMNYSLGTLSLLDVGYVFGHKLHFSDSAVFARLKTNLFATDSSIMAMDFQNNLMLGLDFARSVGDASAWFESAYIVPKYFKKSSSNNLENYYRATIGTDYKLTESIYSYIEYHYNGAGNSDAAKYIFSQSKTAYTEGGAYLYGVHYIAPGMTYEISSLWKLTAQFLFNLNDASIFNNLSAEFNMAQDMFIDLGGYIPFGKETRSFQQRSEFGSYPKSVYTSFRMYF